MAQHILNGSLEDRWLYQSLIDGLLQILIVGTIGEVYIITAINGCSGLFYGCLQTWNLINGCIVTHHHPIETQIASQDIVQDFIVGHTFRSMHFMIARHHDFTARLTDHHLVGQQNLFHHLLLLRLTATAIAEVVF